MIDSVKTPSAPIFKCIPPAPGGPTPEEIYGPGAPVPTPPADAFRPAQPERTPAPLAKCIPPAPGGPLPGELDDQSLPWPAWSSASSSASEPPAPPTKKWTILVYAAADNNLYAYEYGNLVDIESVGSTDQFNVVTQFDAGGSGCTRMLMQKCETPDGSIGSPVVQDMGPTVNMSDPAELADFVKWGMATYPAEHYMLIINDHGDGWGGCIEDRGSVGWMSLPQVREGLQAAQDATGKKLDVVGFDACLMGMAEVAHELSDNADYIVASQETEGDSGWPYSRVLTAELLGHLDTQLSARIPMTPRDMAMAAVDQSSSMPEDLPTMAAYDMAKEPALKAAVDALSSALTASAIDAGRLTAIAAGTQAFDSYHDLYDFCEGLEAEPTAGTEVAAAAAGVKQAIDDLVVAEQHSSDYPNAHGVSIELNDQLEGYADVRFAQSGDWMAVQDKIQLPDDDEGRA